MARHEMDPDEKHELTRLDRFLRTTQPRRWADIEEYAELVAKKRLIEVLDALGLRVQSWADGGLLDADDTRLHLDMIEVVDDLLRDLRAQRKGTVAPEDTPT